jgi:hypothetical protein
VENKNFFLRILHSFCVFREYEESIETSMENSQKVFSGVHEEYDKIKVICGTQNRFRISEDVFGGIFLISKF